MGLSRLKVLEKQEELMHRHSFAMLFANYKTNAMHVGVLLCSIFPALVACSSVTAPIKFVWGCMYQLFELIPVEVKIMCAWVLILGGVVGIIVGLCYLVWQYEWVRSLILVCVAEWYRVETVRPFVVEVSNLVSSISEDSYDVEVHVCGSPSCRYMVHICDLRRNPNSDYGFCDKALNRLASPSGVYILNSLEIVEEKEFKYNKMINGFPLFDPKGINVLSANSSLYVRTHRPNPISLIGYRLFVNNPEVVRFDPFLLKIFGDVKFEAANSPFNYANKIRAGLSNEKTVFKTVVDLYHMDLVAMYREFAVIEGGGLFPGVYDGNLYWSVDSMLKSEEHEAMLGERDHYTRRHLHMTVTRNTSEELWSRCKAEIDNIVQKEEAPESSNVVKEGDRESREVVDDGAGVMYVPTLATSPQIGEAKYELPPVVQIPIVMSEAKKEKMEYVPTFISVPKKLGKSSEYVHSRTDPMHTLEEDVAKSTRMTGALLVESITGIETDDVDLLHDPSPQEVVKELKNIKVTPKQSSDLHAKEGKRAVQYGLVFGAEGVIYDKGERTNLQALWKRVDKPVPEPTRKIEIGSKVCEVNPNTTKFEDKLLFTPGNYISTDEVFRDMSWVDQKVVKMNAMQKARLIKILNQMQTDAEYSWKARSSNKLQVKFFPKPDELLSKPKPRIITFVPTLVWIRIVLLLDSFLSTIKREDNPYNVMRFTVGSKEVDIYWASGMDQSTLSKAATVAQQNFESDGTLFFFVCGDDNTSHNFSVDFSSYDCTQSEFFFKLQSVLFLSRFDAKDRSKLTVLLDEMFKYHKGDRCDMFNDYKVGKDTLPSGAPWTLVFNTLGTIVFALLWVMAAEGQKTHRSHLGAVSADVMEKTMPTALECLGLSATHSRNPQPGSLAGVEFLKGVFVPYRSNQVDKLYWIPVDGRIYKVGKVILESVKNQFTNAQLAARITSIANGYASFNLGPIMSAFVATWSNGVSRELNQYTISGKTNLDDFEEILVQPGFWDDFYKSRYNISKEELQRMTTQIRKNGKSFAKFLGGGWSRLVQADYLGRSF